MKRKERIANQRAITTSNEVVAKEKNNRGITLIALVITIVILLILAGITINLVLSDDGIFSKATEAKNRWAEVEQNEANSLNSLYEQMEGLLDETGNGGGNTGGNSGGNTNTEKTIAEIMAQTEASTENQKAKDIYDNKIVIPAGFKIVANGTSNVIYTYAEGANAGQPTVQDGIVIEDVSAGDTSSQGNQFVWVPIGEINNKDSSKTTITLGRYTFDFSSGNETLVQNATNYTEEIAIDDYWKELETSTYGNATALDLEEWITTAQANGGYYIGRYEASKNGTKAASKPSTGTPPGYGETVSDGMLWNNITQPDASAVSQAMYQYSSNAKVYSDLINSYAWDTAIVFIQEYSGYLNGTTKYSLEIGQTFSTNFFGTNLQNTGTNGDKVCNIYDMASNTQEWTTETSSSFYGPCTLRGGFCDYGNYFTASRGNDYTSNSRSNISFRPTLYVK